MNSECMFIARCRVIFPGLILFASTFAFSQDPGAGVVTPVDTFTVIVPLRTLDDIKKDIEMIQVARTRSKARLYEAKEQVLKLEKQIELKEKETKVLESRSDVAEKEKREGDVASLKLQIEGVEKILDLLEIKKDMHSADVDLAEGTAEYCQVAEDMYERESALTKKRQERIDLEKAGMDSTARATTEKVIREFEDGFLESRVQKLKLEERAVSREQDLTRLQLKVAKAQAKLREKP